MSVTAALLADMLWFLAGRWFGKQIIDALKRSRRGVQRILAKGKQLFARQSVLAIFLAKLSPTPAFGIPLIAGAQRVPWKTFLLEDSFASASWSLLFLAAGFVTKRSMASPCTTYHFLWAALFCGLLGCLIYRKPFAVTKARALKPAEL